MATTARSSAPGLRLRAKHLRARYAATRRARRAIICGQAAISLLTVGVNLDLARLGGRQQRQAHGQHAVGESGLDLVEVERVAKVETTGEGAGNPLAGDQLLVLTGLLGTLQAAASSALWTLRAPAAAA